VGALFALGLLVLALAVMAVGDESSLFTKKASYRVIFPNTDGLAMGSPVKMAGVKVGTVSGIRLSKDPHELGIEVQFGIDYDYAERVRQDSRAALRIVQYLTGEKAVEVTPGSPDVPVLAEGSQIELAQGMELLEQVGEASQNLTDITVSLKNILDDLEQGRGLIGQMISDPEFGREGLDALHGSLVNLRALTNDLLAGKGFVGRLLYDEAFAAKLDDVGTALEKVSALIGSLSLEQGAVGALLQEGGSGQQAIDDFREAAASLKRVTEKMESGEGLIGQLLGGSGGQGEPSTTALRDLEVLLANLAEISGKINRGEGTLGALVNDRTLYDGAEEVTAGVNDSKFARWLLRHYQKKGIKNLEEDEGQPPAGDPSSD